MYRGGSRPHPCTDERRACSQVENDRPTSGPSPGPYSVGIGFKKRCPQCPPHPARHRPCPTRSLPHFAAYEWRPGVPRVAWTMAQPPQTPIPAGLHWGPRAGHRCRAALQAGSPESLRHCCMRSHRRTRWPHIEGRGCCGVPVCDSRWHLLVLGPEQTRVPLRSVVSDPSIHKGDNPTGGRRGSTTPERSSVIANPHMPVDPFGHQDPRGSYPHLRSPVSTLAGSEEPSIIVIEKDDLPDGVNRGWEVLTLPGRED